MPNVTIQDLPPASLPLAGTEPLEALQNGISVQIPVSELAGGITIEDEGIPLVTLATILDFVGAGVTATGAGAEKTITIPGFSGAFVGTGIVAPSAGTPYDYDAELTFQNANSLETATLGWNGTSQLELASVAFGATIAIVGTDAAGVAQTLWDGSPDGNSSMYAAGVEVLQANTADVTAIIPDLIVDPGTAGGVSVQLRNNSFSVVMDMLTATGQMRIFQGSAAGSLQDLWITGTRNGTLILHNNGLESARTVTSANGGLQANNLSTGSGFERVLTLSDLGAVKLTTGAKILGLDNGDPTIPDAITSLFAIHSLNDNQYGQVGFDASSVMVVRSRAEGSGIRLEAEDVGGTVRTLFTGDPDGIAQMMFAGNARIGSLTNGANVLGALFDLDQSGVDALTQMRARNSVGGIDLRVEATTGLGRISQLSAAGAFEDTWMDYTRNGDVGQYNNNVRVTRTVTAANGGLEVNNTLSGGGFEQVATITTGSFTGTLTGFAAGPTPTVQWIKIDNRVTLYITADALAVSNTTAMTMTGIPAALQPTNNKDFITRGVNNSSNVLLAPLLTGGGGVITFGILNATPIFTNTGFTASGNKGLLAGWAISYTLD